MTIKKNHLPERNWFELLLSAFLFAAIGFLIMVVFSPWRPLLGRVNDYLGRIGLIVILLLALFLAGKNKRYRNHRKVIIGLVIMAMAVSLDWILSLFLIESLDVSENTPAGFSLLKLNECFVITSVIILFTRLSGNSLGSIYLKKGNLKLGLTIGFITFFIAAASSISVATLLFKGRDLSLPKIIPWIPWLLIFVLANATLEELLFRGLFLRKLEPLFGRLTSNFLIAFVFTGLHLFASYTSDQYLFIAILFPLALAWGYIMQKTDSVWGSILFHAGMDIPIMLGIFSRLT
jgi:membrane protease YdiL (CAAX protease family)